MQPLTTKNEDGKSAVLPMADNSRIVLGGSVVVCSSIDNCRTTEVYALVCAESPAPQPQPISDEAAILANVQFYLRSLSAKRPAPQALLRAWDSFYEQYQSLIRRVVASSSNRAFFAGEREDWCQEVWKEIVIKLPRLRYSPERGPLSSWLVVLAQRKVRRLLRCQTQSQSRRLASIRSMEDSFLSPQSGPDELCLIGEVRKQIDSALAVLQERTSRTNYEIFCRKVFGNQTAQEIGNLLHLSADEVRYRHHRTLCKWRAVAVEAGLGEEHGASASSAMRRIARIPR